MEICIATGSITWHSQKTHKKEKREKEKREKGKQNDGGRGGRVATNQKHQQRLQTLAFS